MPDKAIAMPRAQGLMNAAGKESCAGVSRWRLVVTGRRFPDPLRPTCLQPEQNHWLGEHRGGFRRPACSSDDGGVPAWVVEARAAKGINAGCRRLAGGPQPRG